MASYELQKVVRKVLRQVGACNRAWVGARGLVAGVRRWLSVWAAPVLAPGLPLRWPALSREGWCRTKLCASAIFVACVVSVRLGSSEGFV